MVIFSAFIWTYNFFLPHQSNNRLETASFLPWPLPLTSMRKSKTQYQFCTQNNRAESDSIWTGEGNLSVEQFFRAFPPVPFKTYLPLFWLFTGTASKQSCLFIIPIYSGTLNQQLTAFKLFFWGPEATKTAAQILVIWCPLQIYIRLNRQFCSLLKK